MAEVWDPFGTIANALWIGGGQWAGKSTVARLLGQRFGLTAYHYDAQDARGHDDRRIAGRLRQGQEEPLSGPSADEVWLGRTPEKMAAAALASFEPRFGWALDDLRALTSPRPIIAEGWGLRPSLVAPLLTAPDRMLVMVPTEEFRRHQTRVLPRAGRLGATVSDPDRGQRQRLARDRLLAADAVRDAREHGIRVVEVDGHQDADAVASTVAEHFRRYLAFP
jgi:hypothetical protein